MIKLMKKTEPLAAAEEFNETACASAGRDAFLKAYHAMTADLFAPIKQAMHREGQTVTVKGVFKEAEV